MYEEQHTENKKQTQAREESSIRFQQLAREINSYVIGQQDTVNAIILCLLCDSHILLEGVPGVAKTTIIKTVAQALGLSFQRIQFTPDLLPADLLGTLVFNQKTYDFETKKGPIFANCILADEINRAPAKVQSALLEAMQERQVTIGSTTYQLDEPFIVCATQNPIEQEGTYRLPEAQIDRFMCNPIMGYPTKEQEKTILQQSLYELHKPHIQLSVDDIMQARKHIEALHCDESIFDYIVSLVVATREPQEIGLRELGDYIECGASPRASIALYQAARAHAFLKNRNFVTPDDVKAVATDILRHRIMKTFHAEADCVTNKQIIDTIITTVSTP